jgi:hypothetical protein
MELYEVYKVINLRGQMVVQILKQDKSNLKRIEMLFNLFDSVNWMFTEGFLALLLEIYCAFKILGI